MRVGLQAIYGYVKRKLTEKHVIWLPITMLNFVDEHGLPVMRPNNEVIEWLREYSPQAFYRKVFINMKVVFPNEAEMIQFKLSFDCPHVVSKVDDSPSTGDYVLAFIELCVWFLVIFILYEFISKLIESLA